MEGKEGEKGNMLASGADAMTHAMFVNVHDV